MKFHPIEEAIEDTKFLAQDYKAAREIGLIKLGTDCVFFKKAFKVFYIKYSNLARAYRRVMLVPAKMCCANGDLPVEYFVLHNSKDEEIAQISMPGAKAGVILLNELKEKSPNTVFMCPAKPKPEKKPGKSKKSQQAYESKKNKEAE